MPHFIYTSIVTIRVARRVLIFYQKLKKLRHIKTNKFWAVDILFISHLKKFAAILLI